MASKQTLSAGGKASFAAGQKKRWQLRRRRRNKENLVTPQSAPMKAECTSGLILLLKELVLCGPVRRIISGLDLRERFMLMAWIPAMRCLTAPSQRPR